MTGQQDIWVHDCPDCKSFPECPCGDGECLATCDFRMLDQMLDKAVDPIRKAVEEFDGSEFSRKLYEKLGINQEKQAEE